MPLSVRMLYDRVETVDDGPTTTASASQGVLTQTGCAPVSRGGVGLYDADHIIVDLLSQFQASISFLELAHVTVLVRAALRL